eukprot:jgi/Ulvmu1/9285/UM050_0034.1
MAPTPVACGPIHTLAKLNEWKPSSDVLDDLTRATVPLPQANVASPGSGKQRMLVCHDMAGGYYEDKWAQGCASSDTYLFEFWQCVDTFIYFSHVLVTIPPVGWINAAHQNGAKMLGTFIMEWEEGAKVCKELFQSRQSAIHAAKQLAKIAEWYGFEGWLINIESQVQVEHVPQVVHFLDTLKAEMHAVTLGNSAVLWYDACDVQGLVRHYCTVNHNNFPFFEACDGMFVDYHWNDQSCRKAVEFLDDRRRNGCCKHGPAQTWFGVDVYGRGTFGGGGWDSDIAVAHAGAQGLSMAVFAPGWIYEEDKGPRSEWPQRSRRLWRLIQDAWVSSRTTVTSLPVSTSFNRGAGHSYRQSAREVSGPWFNMSLQDVQPLWLPPCPPNAHTLGLGALQNSHSCSLSLEPDYTHVFDGGCSVHASGSCDAGGTALAALLLCDAPVAESVAVQYTSRVASGTAAALVLVFAEQDELSAVVLHTDAWTEDMLEETQLHLLDQGMSCQMIQSTITNSAASDPQDDADAEGGWTRNSFRIAGDTDRRLVHVAVVARSLGGGADVSLNLGSLLVQDAADARSAVISGLEVRGEVTRQKHDDTMDSISVLLEWNCPGLHTAPGALRTAVWATEDSDEVGGSREERPEFPSATLVGFSNRCLYFVCPLLVRSTAAAITFVVQPRNLDCSWSSLANSACLSVALPDRA